ncbi:RsmB/NOP family class I SAM-dependent RNA methyltransferase [Pararhodobacter zhoushanensis]|uniref:Methyltransferase domain-containing protein n=1 Tax=Pararhodobacter zhoushanensis TaxID=2479545 RepID=A0ABT3GUT7_9RHOB|nr:transcription antitermination factor NusB [Pararhodobacter zhoushanensis]MCW1931301.1 methyltransferase domain-containing protein [Pararhodobacter zhoushanensis]
MPQPQADPRQLAALLVAGVVEGGMLSEIPLPQAEPAVRARAQRLALTALRNFARTETVLKPWLRREPQPEVMAALRVGTVEMLELGAPPHGVVNATVKALRASREFGAAAGMANAVLRRASEFEGWAELPQQKLPGWLRRRLRAVYGEEGVQAIETAHQAGAALDLTVKPGASAPEGAEPVGGSWRLPLGGQVSALPGFATGDWWVQDAAAALPATLLAVQPGETVLDLCAAPGGKTMQLAAAGAQVTALDLSEPRLTRLRENLARTGLSAEIVCADALHWTPPALVDAVLLDAPCSATGTIRRHPDLPFVRKPADVEELTKLQADLLDRALGFLKPGGRLVYCTCSLLPDEGEAQIAAALTRHPGLRTDTPALPLGRATAEGGWRTRPDDKTGPDDQSGGIDGFYMALLRHDPV